MPKKSFYEMALLGYVDDLEGVLKQEKAVPSQLVKQLDDYYGHSPLYGAISHAFIGTYEGAIVLLEHGADPFQRQKAAKTFRVGVKFELDPPPFTEALIHGHLALIRLMLWYAPDYEKLEIKFRDLKHSRDVNTRAEEYIHWVDADEEKRGKGRNFAKCVQETASDAKTMRELCRTAKLEELARNYKTAASCYKEMAILYAKHQKLEESVKYYPHGPINKDNLTVEEYRKIFINYYKTKKMKSYESAYINYQALDASLSAMVYTDQSSIDAHAEILDQLIELARILSKEAEYRNYLIKAALVRSKTPETLALTEVRHRSLSTETSTSMDDADDAPLLERKIPVTSGVLFRRRAKAVTTADASDVDAVVGRVFGLH